MKEGVRTKRMKQADIKVILWDIDGTLLNFEESERYGIRKCFALFGLGQCDDDMIKAYSEINKVYWQKLERGEIGKKEVLEGRFRDFFLKYNIDVNKASAFNEEYQKCLGDTVVFYENGLEVVRQLKGRIRQYAVTNGTKLAQERKLKNSGLDYILDGIFISEDIGTEKPGIGFFEEVFRKIEPVKREEIMIVGDSLTSDMQGGMNAGILTCWFNPEKKENIPPSVTHAGDAVSSASFHEGIAVMKNTSVVKPDYIIYNLKQVIELVDGMAHSL